MQENIILTTILGIEGTAWNLSAAIVNESDVVAEVTETYRPQTGGPSINAP